MRRTRTMLFTFGAIAAMFVALAMAREASAQVIEGTSGGDVLVGTDNGDKISGYGGSDTLRGKAGGDTLTGGSGDDTLECDFGWDEALGNGDDDLIGCAEADGKADFIDGGSGFDTCFWRVGGTVIERCEQVIRVSLRDASTSGGMAPWCYYAEGDACADGKVSQP